MKTNFDNGKINEKIEKGKNDYSFTLKYEPNNNKNWNSFTLKYDRNKNKK
jgi:hypothetical protein